MEYLNFLDLRVLTC